MESRAASSEKRDALGARSVLAEARPVAGSSESLGNLKLRTHRSSALKLGLAVQLMAGLICLLACQLRKETASQEQGLIWEEL